MAKIVFYLPGNATHSFLVEDRWEAMFRENLGLDAVGQAGIPVAVSHQGIDYDLYPFLKDVHARHKNIEVAGAPYGHGLLPLICFNSKKDTNKQIRWDVENGARINVPVTFFSEFYNPEEWAIPTKFFFLLREQTCSYSLDVGGISLSEKETVVLPQDVLSARYGSRIGIVLDGFKNFLKAWFKFSAVPDSQNLKDLLKQFELLVEDPREFIVVPLDLEQPYVGSVIGQDLWKIFFEALSNHPAVENIVPLRSILCRCADVAVPIQQPHRILTKWTVHDIQFNVLTRLNMLKISSDKERRLFSFASCSDHLSSLNRQALATIRKPMVIKCRDLAGREIDMVQPHNQVLQDCCNAAYEVLRYKDISFREKLERIKNQNFFVQQVKKWAQKYSL